MAKRRTQRYETDGITVTFDPNLCIHSARCLQRQPAVFDVSRRDWVRPEAAPAEAVAEAIRRCPSGALQYVIPGGEAEQPEAPPSVTHVRNGPLYVRGALRIEDAEGGVIAEGTRFALCRCGGSANKPFCDNTHRSNGFASP